MFLQTLLHYRSGYQSFAQVLDLALFDKSTLIPSLLAKPLDLEVLQHLYAQICFEM
jgi:hypothetical protein